MIPSDLWSDLWYDELKIPMSAESDILACVLLRNAYPIFKKFVYLEILPQDFADHDSQLKLQPMVT